MTSGTGTSEAAAVIAFGPVTDFAELGRSWVDLEQRAAGSFFQSWAWTGCLAQERFDDPWLLSAYRGERLVALGLFNRGRRNRLGFGRAFYLGESGVKGWDSVFIEHNGLLIDRAEPPALARQCWAAIAADKDSGADRARWVLSGVQASVGAALPETRAPHLHGSRPAPYIDFTKTGAPQAPFLDHLSANTRQQLRRSLRGWAEIGSLRLEVARTPDEAGHFLDRLKVLHQIYWTGRGKPGAFAEPLFERFHRALLGRAGPGQSVDLIRVSAGAHEVGYLYGFVHHGWVSAYQSGFDFSGDAQHLRPGLVCHLMAIEHYRAAGMRIYDFLGGEARYKRSFAEHEARLVWLDSKRPPPLLSGLRRGPLPPPQNRTPQ